MSKKLAGGEKEVRLLLIDDSAIDRKLLRRLARRVRLPISFEETGDPDFALRLLSVEQFDCILVDYEMPQVDGVQLMKSLNGLLGDKRPPTLMLTGHRHDKLARDALASGFDDFLLKDALTPESFERAIRNALIRRRLAPASDEAEEPPSFDMPAVLDALRSALAAFDANAEARAALDKDERTRQAMRRLAQLSVGEPRRA